MVIELAGLSCPQWVSYIFGIFSEFVDNFDLPDAVEKKKGQSRVDLYCYDAQPCQISFFNSQKPKCKNDSQWESKLFPRASKELTQYVNVLNRTLACILASALHGSKNKTSAMDVFPVDAIMSTRPVSNYSAYYPIYNMS